MRCLLQEAKLKRLFSLAVMASCLCWSSHIGGLKFLAIHEPLVIKAQRNSPPHIAFEEIIESEQKPTEWARFENVKAQTLAVQKHNTDIIVQTRIELPEMVIKKSAEVLNVSGVHEGTNNNQSQHWIEELPRSQAIRLQEAQRRAEILGENWTGKSWADSAREVLEKSGALVADAGSAKVYVSATNEAGQSRSQVPQSQVIFQNEESGNESVRGRAIVGPIEITGGLAVTNEHHIEVRRSDEGVLKELGKVDLSQGLYNIEVENTTGTVVARLVDKEGRTLGEGSFRLTRLGGHNAKSLQGPKLKIEPHPSFSGVVASLYSSRPNEVAPPQTRVTFIKGASEVLAKRDGLVSMDNVTKGSTTLMRVAAPNHLQTAAIITSGDEFKASMYPVSMIQALHDITSEQRNMSFEGAPTVIWGRVSVDGKESAGVEVFVESEPDLQPIYFNQFLLPDPSLKATGENGIFAFAGVSGGFHSILATKAQKIVGYQNVVIEEGSVAQGDVVGSSKVDTVPLRLFDAFSGEVQSATVTMQSLDSEVEVLDGVATVSLPRVHRQGLLSIQTESRDFISARYVYNDTDEFVHIPLIQWNWLTKIKNYLRLDDHPSAGQVVGFVPDEDFEVYIAGYEDLPARNIVYFDMQGRILPTGKGMAGGGFILFNVPEDTHEVIVIGSRTQKIYSRVLPVDANSVSVLSFREFN